MVISLARMLQSFGQDDLPTMAAKTLQQTATQKNHESNHNSVAHNFVPDRSETKASETSGSMSNSDAPAQVSALTAPKRAERICAALAQVSDIGTPTPLTDRYLTNRAQWRSPNRPPFDPDTLNMDAAQL